MTRGRYSQYLWPFASVSDTNKNRYQASCYHLLEKPQQTSWKRQGLTYLCKKPQSQGLWGWRFCELQSKVFSCQVLKMPWEARGQGFGGEFTSSGGWQLPSAGKWDGAEPHGHGDIQQKPPPSHRRDSSCPVPAPSSSCLAPGGENPGQLGLGHRNRAGAQREGKRFVFSFLAVSTVKRCCRGSLRILIEMDNLWATWTLQTLTPGSFHKHACRIWEQISPGLDGIDQYFSQQLLSCGKGKCGAEWQTEDWISLLSRAVSQPQSWSSSPWSHRKFSSMHKWDLDQRQGWVRKHNLHWNAEEVCSDEQD